jgi:DNA-binding LacI/PurR family transcriptional regulator
MTSRVLNDKPDVADETRRRAWQVTEVFGYQPGTVARSLTFEGTHTLGLITADFSDRFFTQAIIGAEIEARRSGYFFLLGSTERTQTGETRRCKAVMKGHTTARGGKQHEQDDVRGHRWQSGLFPRPSVPDWAGRDPARVG